MGKSQLLKQVLLNNAMEGRRAGLVSIEETGSKIGENLLSNRGGVENSRIVYNRLDQDEWGRIEKARNEIADLPLFIDDAQFRISSIVATIRRLVKRHGCQIVGVDHLHLIDGETDANRTQEVTAISRTLKNTFKALGVAGVVCLQMNRRGASEQDAKPELDQLRDSEALVFDGDLIIQLHRRDYYEWKKAGPNFVPDHRLEVYVNKNKGGPVGSRELYFDGDTQSVGDWNGGAGPNAPRQVPEAMFE
jgi:replicative DNA helicase